MNKDIIICGVGGQGTVLASKILAAAATDSNETVHSAETIGMAQRGGSVTSHVRIGQDAYSPLVPFGNADLILAFEPAEAVRNLKYLRKDGLVVVNSAPVKPVTESLTDTGYDGSQMLSYLSKKCKCIVIDGEKIAEKFGSSKFFNIAILGVAAGSGVLGLTKENLLNQVEKRVPAKFLDKNREAFFAGFEIGEKNAN